MKETYYVKTMDADLKTKTIVGQRKIICQSMEHVIQTQTLVPNTNCFNTPIRLCTSILSDAYQDTYRPDGIIFTTNHVPEFVSPCDLALLTVADDIAPQYSSNRTNIGTFYAHNLLQGYEHFLCKDFAQMIERFPNSKIAQQKVNAFRAMHAKPAISNKQMALIEYNEAVFYNPITIRPVALFGEHTKQLAQQTGLLHYQSAQAFYESHGGSQ